MDIPFSFYYPWELAKEPRVDIGWRLTHFHGEYLYNRTLSLTHNNYKNRIELTWTKGSKNGSLRIRNLRKEDETTYFCRIRLDTRTEGSKVWQSINGTKLSIIPGESNCPAATVPTAGARRPLGPSSPGLAQAPLFLPSLRPSPCPRLLPRPLPT